MPSLFQKKAKYYLIPFVLYSFMISPLPSQSSSTLKTVDLTRIILENNGNEGFIATDNKLFRVKIYTLSEARVDETNHWFFRLLDKDGKELNYAQIQLNGHLRSNPSVKLDHAGRIVPLGSDGKYIIKSVKVKQKGIWSLSAIIDNLGKEDTITYEIEVNQ